MIVPNYWAEGNIRDRIKGKQVTIRRFGWSDASESEAQSNADQRAREAMARFREGAPIIRREPKLAYNGAEGVPIREEIISRHGETVVTRNLYGARCLNTPNVLFADIDFEETVPVKMTIASILFLLAASIAAGAIFHSNLIGFSGSVVSLVLGYVVASAIHRFRQQLGGGPEKQARRRINQFSANHPDWHLRVYRTPAGFRVLVMHRTFIPNEAEVADFFKALGTDPLYVRMCINQKCFRARVSPKPWRIRVSTHIKPRPGVWPVNPKRLPERSRWIEEYENKAKDYSACEFVEAIGSGATNQTAQSVQKLHDDLSRATSGLPSA